MKVKELLQDDNFLLVSGEDLDVEIKGLYSGDLLSWVMSHAKEQNAWCTVLTHVNIIAIASLLQLSCVIVCENASIDEDTIEKAKKEKVILLHTKLSVVEVIQKMLINNG